MTDIHFCSYYCDRPECIKAQRDELRRMFVENKDAQGIDVSYDNALNEAGWAFIEACPEKSALLFNHCKPSLKVAIETWLSARASYGNKLRKECGHD